VPKPPLFINSSLYGINYLNCSVDALYSDPTLYVEGQKRFQERFTTDIVPNPVYLVGEALQFGTTQKIQERTAPVLKNTYYEATGKMPGLKSSFDHPFYGYYLEASRLMKEAFPNKQLAAFVTSPVDYGIMVFGTLKWIDMLLFDKRTFDEWLEAFADYHNKFKKTLAQCGVDIFITSNVFLNNLIIPDEMITRTLIPHLNTLIDPNYPAIIHSTFMPVTECVKRLEGLKSGMGYLLGEQDDFGQMRQMVSGRKMLVGNLGSEYLFKKTPETIERKVASIMAEMKDDENFILSTSGADLNLATTEQQLSSIYRGIEYYGN